jgi:hypothetical protein
MLLSKTIPFARLLLLAGLPAGLLSAQALTITSSTTLLPASVAIPYQPFNLTATGGTPPYTWSVIGVGVNGLPPGMTLSSTGVLSGQATSAAPFDPQIRVMDSVGTVFTQQFSLNVGPGETLLPNGILAQIADGGGWVTTIYLVNTSPDVVNAAVVTFRSDAGTQLAIPLSILQQGITQSVNVSQWNFVLNPNTTVVLETTTPTSGTLQQGWAEVDTNGGVNAFAIFRQTTANGVVAEGTVATQAQIQSSLVVPYDNTQGNTSTAAMVSLSTATITVTATIYDQNGNNLGTQQLTVPAKGRPMPAGAFAIPTLFPVTAGKAGTITFTNVTNTDPISGIAFTFGSLLGGSFTSVPVLPTSM